MATEMEIHREKKPRAPVPPVRSPFPVKPVIGQIDFIVTSSPRQGSRSSSFRKKIFWSCIASVYDFLIIIGSAGVCFAMAAVLLKSEVLSLVNFFYHSNFLTILGFAVAISFFYSLLLRQFMGCTLGEWSCRLQLGTYYDQAKANYILQVSKRYLLVFFTGIFVLPLLSFFANRDLAGEISGLLLETE